MPRKNNANSSTSRASQSETHETVGFSTTEIQNQSNNIVKYVLNNIASKIPFKRQDIVKNVLNGNNRLFDAIFAQSCDKLKDVFGIAVAQVEEVKTGKQYITHSIPTLCAQELNSVQQREVTLLYLVLSYIFMKGSEINEITLFNFLDALHIKENENHTYFGNVTKYIQEIFPKQLYLKRTKVKIEGSDEDRISLRWGQRAELEFDKKEILQFVGRIMKKPPQSFTNQFGEVFGEPMEADDVEVSQVIDNDNDDEDM